MNTSTKPKATGFTIIEVVLVLAIAGLIFLIVFLAVPALQRSQRDTQRKNDVGRLVAAIQSYQSNQRGLLPADLGGTGTGNIMGSNYLGNFADPSAGTYTFASVGTADISAAAPTTATTGQINYKVAANCDNTTAGNRKVAVVVSLEGGGTYCQTN